MYQHQRIGIYSGVKGGILPSDAPEWLRGHDGEKDEALNAYVFSGREYASLPLSSIERVEWIDAIEYYCEIGGDSLSEEEVDNLESALSAETPDSLERYFPDSSDS